MRKIGRYLKRWTPTILTIASSAGTIGTGVLAAKAVPKAKELTERARRNNGAPLTKFEAMIAAAPAYIPAAGCAVISIACSFGANALNLRQQNALIASYAMLDRIHREYTNKVKELYGEEADRKVRREIVHDRLPDDQVAPWDEKIIFYEEHYGRFFERTKEQVMEAEYHFNRNFALRSYANLNEFYEFLGLEKTEEGENIGWSMEAGEISYGYSWVDFEHRTYTTDDGMVVCEICMPFPPTADYLDPWGE